MRMLPGSAIMTWLAMLGLTPGERVFSETALWCPPTAPCAATVPEFNAVTVTRTSNPHRAVLNYPPINR